MGLRLFNLEHICTTSKQGALFWFSVANFINILAGILFIFSIFVLLALLALSVVTLGLIAVFVPLAFVLWLPFDVLYFVIGAYACQAHVRAVADEGDGFSHAFLPAKTTNGSNALSFLNWLLHLLGVLTSIFLIGGIFFIICPLISVVCVILGILGAEDY